ncbi:TPA: DUF1330 domain-containing protein [Stenotrophomonas maltophilia]|nr:DUF1330 domain-containing protein [Stenotrophomonas maltophilia]HDS1043427.1 DUF1330 domain-containing protein [Stenotrophomonas maltophilia]
MLETAEACNASPEYQHTEPRARREGHCIASVVIVEG